MPRPFPARCFGLAALFTLATGMLVAAQSLPAAPQVPARPASPPVQPADPPKLPPFAGTLVNFDRVGEFAAACALDLGGGETKRGARAVPNTHVWVFHREIIRELGASPGACDPVWSPDGSRLAVVTPNGLWTYTPTLEEPRQLAEASLPDPPKNAHDYTAFSAPRWSPDGTRLAYKVTNGEATWVEVVDVASTRRLLRTEPGVKEMAWAADSSSVKIDGRDVALPK